MERAAPIRIVGTGPVSLLLRGLLAREGFGPHELACDPIPDTLPPWLAQRAIALSLGSWQLLGRVAPLPPAAAITAVEVSLRGAAGRTRLGAGELKAPALGHVVRYEALHRTLREAIAGPGGPPPADGDPTDPDDQPPAVTIVADGDPGADSQVRDFDQAALLATIRVSRPRAGTAFERFTDEGPLALLPLPENRLWSLVWCAPTELSHQRRELPAEALAALLEARFGAALGRLEVCDTPHLAPLQRRLRTQPATGTRLAIGNAAQALHPVAGQGMNLGLRDAFVLAGMLGEARRRGRPLADTLPEYVRARRPDRKLTVGVTDLLATVFTQPLLHPLQSLALGVLDLAGPARRALARGFMFGLRD